MNNKDSVQLPRFVNAVETVVEKAKEDGDYPQIFEEEQIIATLYKVIELSGVPYETHHQLVVAGRFAKYHLGLYMQEHKLV